MYFFKMVKQTIVNVLRITRLGKVEEMYDLLQLQLLVEPTNSDKLVQLYRHCSTYHLNFKGFLDTLERFKVCKKCFEFSAVLLRIYFILLISYCFLQV